MDNFLQQLINGLTLGSIYGLIAIGYTMVFGIIGMVNFAHGDVFMLSAFIALIIFMILTQILGLGSLPLVFIVVLIAAMALRLLSFAPCPSSVMPSKLSWMKTMRRMDFHMARRPWIRMRIPQEDSATSTLYWRTCLAWV